MAKAGFWLRGAKGKLAGTVLQKGENGTIQRENVKPKNPQSNSQMAHRIIFATVTQAAKFMFPLIKQSFEGFPEGQLSRREFVRINTKHLRALAAEDYENQTAGAESNTFVTTKGISALIPNRYVVANGTLNYGGALKAVYDEDIATFGFEANVSGLSIEMDENSVMVKIDTLVNAVFGLYSANEQLSIARIKSSSSNVIFEIGTEAGEQIVDSEFCCDRLVFKTIDNSQLTMGTWSNGTFTKNPYLVEEFSEVIDKTKTSESMLKFMQRLFNAFVVTVDTENNTLSADMSPIPFEVGANELAAGVIKSAFVEGAWKRSKAIMAINPPVEYNYGLYYNAGIAAWFTGGAEITDNGKFLNEGGQANSI